MKKHRNILRLIAVLALAAWANIQVMACCWSFSTPPKSVAVVSSEHDCCRKASEPVKVIPDGSGTISVSGKSCCNHDEDLALQSSAPAMDLAAVNTIELSEIQSQPSSNFYSPSVYRGSGPPSSLVFQRLLI